MSLLCYGLNLSEGVLQRPLKQKRSPGLRFISYLRNILRETLLQRHFCPVLSALLCTRCPLSPCSLILLTQTQAGIDTVRHRETIFPGTTAPSKRLFAGRPWPCLHCRGKLQNHDGCCLGRAGSSNGDAQKPSAIYLFSYLLVTWCLHKYVLIRVCWKK